MVRPNPRFDPQSPKDEWIMDGGYDRNLYLEKILQDAVSSNNKEYNRDFKGGLNPTEWGHGLPSWWYFYQTNCGGVPRVCLNVTAKGYEQQGYTKQEALEFCKLVIKINEAVNAWDAYRCSNYPRDPVYCRTRNIGDFDKYAKQLEKEISEDKGFIIETPEILPQVFAQEEPSVMNGIMEPEPVTVPTLSSQVLQIINDISNQKIIAPAWFVNNNINWVISGHISEHEFLTAYNQQVEVGNIYPVKPTIDDSITDNMITQKIDYFTIENGRAIGQITFTATQNFNPFYYNKTIANIIQFKDRNDANILPTVKQNNLRFTETERTETIQYDEGMNDNIYSKVSSFVWSSVTTPTAFSKQTEFEIREKEPVKPISSGFMSAGVAGAIAGLVLLGFIVDSKVSK